MKKSFLFSVYIFFWLFGQSQTPGRLKVMAWNIAEGRDGSTTHHVNIPAIADRIKSKNPDLVFINEALNRTGLTGDGKNQIKVLQTLTGLPYYGWGNTVATGITGWKAVGILSRFPLTNQLYIPVISSGVTTTYGMYKATIAVDGAMIDIYSLRFDAWHINDLIAGHNQLAALINSSPNRPVIIGGDFNNVSSTPQFINFKNASGITNIYELLTDPDDCGGDPIDFILYKELYLPIVYEKRCTAPNPSDHPWVYTELLRNFYQPDWKWCNKCQGLFFSGGKSSVGKCPTGGQHEKGVSGNYYLAHNQSIGNDQSDWRWCSKCYGLFHAGGQPEAGVCPDGGKHQKGISGNYSLPHNSPNTPGQSDWRWCNKCSGLFFSGGQSTAGTCPTGGKHIKGVSGNYTLVHTPKL